jgi:putative addiction module killer protein
MIEIRKTAVFETWFSHLRDRQARARISIRIDRLALGNPGDTKPVGGGVSEMRIDHGPGYRVYFARQGAAVIVLLAGGDKRTQDRDIRAALELVRQL